VLLLKFYVALLPYFTAVTKPNESCIGVSNQQRIMAFKVATHADRVQIDTEKLELICDCTKSEIALAVSKYNALLVERMFIV
jgi:hypothetical protein